MLKLITLTLLVAIAPSISHGNERQDENRGQSVAECNHRANERDLQAQERKQFVDRCVSAEWADVDDQWDRYRECHARAVDRGLNEADRRQYVENCVGHTAFNAQRW